MSGVVLLATRNADKLREIRDILGPAGERLVPLHAILPIAGPKEDEIERFDSFEENAAAKALYFARLTGLATLADDSGLCVDALAGAPGVRSRRFARDSGIRSGDADSANNHLLLARLAATPEGKRGAEYVCSVAVATPDRVIGSCLGRCRGTILRKLRGQGGFGYDPLFYLPSEGCTFAELSALDKNLLSHRARALREVKPLLLAALDELGPPGYLGALPRGVAQPG